MPSNVTFPRDAQKNMNIIVTDCNICIGGTSDGLLHAGYAERFECTDTSLSALSILQQRSYLLRYLLHRYGYMQGHVSSKLFRSITRPYEQPVQAMYTIEMWHYPHESYFFNGCRVTWAIEQRRSSSKA